MPWRHLHDFLDGEVGAGRPRSVTGAGVHLGCDHGCGRVHACHAAQQGQPWCLTQMSALQEASQAPPAKMKELSVVPCRRLSLHDAQSMCSFPGRDPKLSSPPRAPQEGLHLSAKQVTGTAPPLPDPLDASVPQFPPLANGDQDGCT